MIILKGIRTKKQLNKTLVDILRETGRKMSANQLVDYLLTHYKTANLRINSLIVCKRLAGQPHVVKEYNKSNGIHYYFYVE